MARNFDPWPSAAVVDTSQASGDVVEQTLVTLDRVGFSPE